MSKTRRTTTTTRTIKQHPGVLQAAMSHAAQSTTYNPKNAGAKVLSLLVNKYNELVENPTTFDENYGRELRDILLNHGPNNSIYGFASIHHFYILQKFITDPNEYKDKYGHILGHFDSAGLTTELILDGENIYVNTALDPKYLGEDRLGLYQRLKYINKYDDVYQLIPPEKPFPEYPVKQKDYISIIATSVRAYLDNYFRVPEFKAYCDKYGTKGGRRSKQQRSRRRRTSRKHSTRKH